MLGILEIILKNDIISMIYVQGETRYDFIVY